MDVFEHFAPVAEKVSSTWEYHRLLKCQTVDGAHGLFFRLTCVSDDGEPEIVATCDNTHREHLRPYLDELLKSEGGTKSDPPSIPLFQGRDGKWRFSYWGAEEAFPYLRDLRETQSRSASTARSVGCATRLQVSCSQELANRFKQCAFERGVSHTDLLLELVRSTVNCMG